MTVLSFLMVTSDEIFKNVQIKEFEDFLDSKSISEFSSFTMSEWTNLALEFLKAKEAKCQTSN